LEGDQDAQGEAELEKKLIIKKERVRKVRFSKSRGACVGGGRKSGGHRIKSADFTRPTGNDSGKNTDNQSGGPRQKEVNPPSWQIVHTKG